MKKVIVGILFWLIFPVSVNAAAPTILPITSPSTTGKYQKAEWVFDLSKSYTNPYYYYDVTDTPSANPGNCPSGQTVCYWGVDGVSVDLHLTSPTNKSIVLPAYWQEDYVRTNFGGYEALGRKDNGHWHARFAPSETGSYQWYFTATDKDGSTQGVVGNLAVTASNSKGFIHTSSVDSRFLSYDNGEAYIPIASGHQWWSNNSQRSYDYEAAFTTFGQNGINLSRVWDHNDGALGVEGAQPVWIRSDFSNLPGAALGTEIATANVYQGLRSAKPAVGNTLGWYQRLAIAEPTKSHLLTAWIKNDNGSKATIAIRNGSTYGSGTLLGSIVSDGSTTAWKQYSTTFTPGTGSVLISLSQSLGTGNVYIDNVAFGPDDGNGGVNYNIVSDGDFERHFAKDTSGNDPNANPSLIRPIGNYFNQWSAFELDKIVESAQTNGVAIQLCSCSGPWFTWPKNGEQMTDAEHAQTWYINSWKRNFRYRVGRWGYSTSILGWENFNETGHINPSGSPGMWNYSLAYTAYQAATDPYKHLRTSSQNSQAYSPQYWSTLMDLANYHWYIDGHSATLDADETTTVNRFAWCLSDTRGTSSPYCQGLGLGDGTSWSGGGKPWVWGEMGIQFAGYCPNSDNAVTCGEYGARFFHNIVFAGLFSPLGTTPIDWWWYHEDATATTQKNLARKAAANYFAGVDYAGGKFNFLMTPADAPPGYSGENVTASDPKARVLAMRRADQKAAYLWVQHRDYTWKNGTVTPSTIIPIITIGNLLNQVYKVEIWSTHTTTTQIISTNNMTPVSGILDIVLPGMNNDMAVKIELVTGLPTVTPTIKSGDANGDGKVDGIDYVIWLNHYGQNLSGAGAGDFNNDGKVDGVDYVLWLNNYGK